MREEGLLEAPLRTIRLYKERRANPSERYWEERRVQCWTIENCDPAVRAKCHAYIVRVNCWDFWVLKGAKHKGCCQKLDDCRQCSVVRRKFADCLPVFVRPAQQTPNPASPASVAAPVICTHLHVIGGPLPEGRALRQMLHEQAQDDHDNFRCRRRGVHLDPNYVGDICATRCSRDCVFL